MKRICLVAPLESDKDSESKIQIARHHAFGTGIELFIPEQHAIFGVQQLNEFIATLKGTLGMIADLSFERPSVYYELGVAECLDMACVLIARSETPIHQSANRDDVILYRDLDEYESAIAASIASIKSKNA